MDSFAVKVLNKKDSSSRVLCGRSFQLIPPYYGTTTGENWIRLTLTGTGVTHQSLLPFWFQSLFAQLGLINGSITWERIRKRQDSLASLARRWSRYRSIAITYDSSLICAIENWEKNMISQYDIRAERTSFHMIYRFPLIQHGKRHLFFCPAKEGNFLFLWKEDRTID